MTFNTLLDLASATCPTTSLTTARFTHSISVTLASLLFFQDGQTHFILEVAAPT